MQHSISMQTEVCRDFGAELKESNGAGDKNVLLSFTEARTGLKHVASITGIVTSSCSEYGFTGAVAGCPYDGLTFNVYITSHELKKQQ